MPLVKEEEVQNTGRTCKLRAKEVADRKQHAKPQPLVPRDNVLVKQWWTNKTTLSYDPEHYTITKIRGTQIIPTKSNRKVISQHKTFFHQLWEAEKCDGHPTPTSKSDIKFSSDSEVEDNNMSNSNRNEEEVNTSGDVQLSNNTDSDIILYTEQMEAPVRPTCNRKTPPWYRDFIW